jgi:hypothetical protein
MAYINQQKKSEIVAAAKAALPKDWTVSFSISHHSTLVATITKAPASVLDDYKAPEAGYSRPYVNHHHLANCWSGEAFKVLDALRGVMMIGNHDRSDSQSDYFDVGWYVEIQFGKRNKPCVFTASAEEVAA